jgi:branched-chain amino acid transport system permease protein
MTSATFLQLVVGGLTMGSIYALVAKGLYITHLTTHRVNFGQGDYMMVAGFLMLGIRALGGGLLLAIAGTVIGLALMGYLLERVAIRPLDRYRSSAIGAYGWILTTAGVALIFTNVVELVWGKSAQYSPPLFSERRDDVVEILGARFFIEELLVIVCAMLVVALFLWFMRRTRWGKAIEVVAFNPEAAQLLGIDTRAVKVSVFVIASLLAAIAGVLIGPIVTLQPHIGLIFTIKALIVASVGGFSNPLGILLGGFLFGVAESFSNYVDSQFGDVYPLLVALAIVAIRPSGLFGERSQEVR